MRPAAFSRSANRLTPSWLGPEGFPAGLDEPGVGLDAFEPLINGHGEGRLEEREVMRIRIWLGQDSGEFHLAGARHRVDMVGPRRDRR